MVAKLSLIALITTLISSLAQAEMKIVNTADGSGELGVAVRAIPAPNPDNESDVTLNLYDASKQKIASIRFAYGYYIIGALKMNQELNEARMHALQNFLNKDHSGRFQLKILPNEDNADQVRIIKPNLHEESMEQFCDELRDEKIKAKSTPGDDES